MQIQYGIIPQNKDILKEKKKTKLFIKLPSNLVWDVKNWSQSSFSLVFVGCPASKWKRKKIILPRFKILIWIWSAVCLLNRKHTFCPQ